MINVIEKSKIIEKFGGSKKNTGATEVQIAVLTSEIEKLKNHFQINKKDNHSRRGFIAKIEKRKKFLLYLKKTNYDSYKLTIQKLGIRK